MYVKKWFAVALIVTTCFINNSHASSSDSEFVVEDIKVLGLQRVALGAALTYIPVNVGDQMNEFRVSQLIKSLYRSTHFEKIDVLRDENTLVIVVKERPTISNIDFSGNDDIKDEQLQESLDNSGIRIGEPLDRTILTSIENGLKDFFYGVGKYNADIDVTITPLPRNRVDVKLVFDEGDAADIQQINIVGNDIFSDDELLEQIELKFDTPWWDFMTPTRYQKQTLDGDLETIRSYYMDRGYLRYSLDSTQVSMTPDKQGVYITLNVSEGEQYTIKNVEFAGDLLGFEDVLTRLLPLREGQLYNLAEVTYTEEMVSKYLGRFGYAFPQVTTIPDIDDDNKEVSLTINVQPGKRVYVNRVNFTGNSVTADEVLRRDVVQMEGAWLSNISLESSKSRLQRLPYMEEVEFETVRIPGEDDKVDVNFTVKEQASGSFNAGIGYGDASGLSLQAGVQQENFLGTGNRVGVNISTVSYSRNLNFSYYDPYFTIDGISLGGNFFLSEFDAGQANLEAYKNTSYGVGVNFGYPVNEFNRLSYSFTYKHNEITQFQTYEQVRNFYDLYADPDDPDAGLEFDSFELGIAWIRSTLNRGLFPTSGSSQRLSLKATTPNSDVDYFKVDFDSKFYFPIDRRQRWSVLAKLRLGYGNGYGTKEDNDQLLPFFENFRAGGSGTLRGFENNTVGPRPVYLTATTTDCVPQADGSCTPIVLGPESSLLRSDPGTLRSIGGNALAVGGVELIFPTPFIEEDFSNSVRTSFFFDVGNVWDTEFDREDYSYLPDSQYALIGDYGDPLNLRASTGIAVQWISPMGPMIFSFANAIQEQRGDDTRFFSFNVGSTF